MWIDRENEKQNSRMEFMSSRRHRPRLSAVDGSGPDDDDALAASPTAARRLPCLDFSRTEHRTNRRGRPYGGGRPGSSKQTLPDSFITSRASFGGGSKRCGRHGFRTRRRGSLELPAVRVRIYVFYFLFLLLSLPAKPPESAAATAAVALLPHGNPSSSSSWFSSSTCSSPLPTLFDRFIHNIITIRSYDDGRTPYIIFYFLPYYNDIKVKSAANTSVRVVFSIIYSVTANGFCVSVV